MIVRWHLSFAIHTGSSSVAIRAAAAAVSADVAARLLKEAFNFCLHRVVELSDPLPWPPTGDSSLGERLWAQLPPVAVHRLSLSLDTSTCDESSVATRECKQFRQGRRRGRVMAIGPSEESALDGDYTVRRMYSRDCECDDR